MATNPAQRSLCCVQIGSGTGWRADRPPIVSPTRKVDGATLEEKLRMLGADLTISGFAEELEITIVAPSSTLSAAFSALATALPDRELSKDDFAAAKATTASWTKPVHDEWNWYWDVLGLSAPRSHYAHVPASARRSALERLKLSEVAQLWRTMAQQPRAIALVGPFDTATARALGAKLTRSASAPPTRQKPRTQALFRPGVYLLDRPPRENSAKEKTAADAESIDVCVLWPLPRWATPGHYPARLMPWFFLTDISDGLGVRFEEHKARIPWWESNTLINRDEDFFRQRGPSRTRRERSRHDQYA